MLPETLKELREERGMKQAQIAIILGVKQNTYSNWENGTRNPSLEMLVKIADYYKTSTDYLLGRYKEKECPAGDNPPAGLVYIMQFLLNHRLAKYKISLSLFPLAKLPLFLIPNGYVPPFAEIRRFFKIKIRRPSLRLFL